jgi:hypothetical protein
MVSSRVGSPQTALPGFSLSRSRLRKLWRKMRRKTSVGALLATLATLCIVMTLQSFVPRSHQRVRLRPQPRHGDLLTSTCTERCCCRRRRSDIPRRRVEYSLTVPPTSGTSLVLALERESVFVPTGPGRPEHASLL